MLQAVGQGNDPVLIDCTQCKLRVAWRAELTNQHNIPQGPQRPSDMGSDRNGTTGDRKHETVPPDRSPQGLKQLIGGVVTIAVGGALDHKF